MPDASYKVEVKVYRREGPWYNYAIILHFCTPFVFLDYDKESSEG